MNIASLIKAIGIVFLCAVVFCVMLTHKALTIVFAGIVVIAMLLACVFMVYESLEENKIKKDKLN